MVSFSFSFAGTGNSASAPRSYKKLSMYNQEIFSADILNPILV